MKSWELKNLLKNKLKTQKAAEADCISNKFSNQHFFFTVQAVHQGYTIEKKNKIFPSSVTSFARWSPLETKSDNLSS